MLSTAMTDAEHANTTSVMTSSHDMMLAWSLHSLGLAARWQNTRTKDMSSDVVLRYRWKPNLIALKKWRTFILKNL